MEVDEAIVEDDLVEEIPEKSAEIEDKISVIPGEIPSDSIISDPIPPIINIEDNQKVDDTPYKPIGELSDDKIDKGSPCQDTEVEPEAIEPDQIDLSAYHWPYKIDLDLMDKSPPVPLTSTNKSEFDSFLKGCKWAPDGSCLLSNSEDNILRIYNLPGDLSQGQDWPSKDSSEEMLNPVLKITEGGQIYDYNFFPNMSSFDPITCCFLTTSSRAPIHLWDAFTGTLRCSYRVFNHLDEPIAAYCCSFDRSGHQIFCGYDKFIKVFDISRPGRECSTRLLTKNPISDLNQSGIVSTIVFNPIINYLYAVGTFRNTVGLYTEDGTVLGILEGHMGGVTHMKFSNDGTKLFSGARKDPRLICWDVRMLNNEYKIYERVSETHQRIYFDITNNDQYLITGGSDGFVRIWDLKAEEAQHKGFRASLDCVNGVSINPFVPLLCSASGQRHFQEIESDSESEEMFKVSQSKKDEDNSVKLWKLI